jgi:predicted alpha/beta hydrolase family esterase
MIPRWSGRVDGEWYPWLKQELLDLDPSGFELVSILDMPDPDLPKPETWVPEIARAVGADPEELERTVLVGHSIGCQAILRYLETFPPDRRILGMLGVAGFWQVDDPWITLSPWLDVPLNLARVKSAAEKFVILISRDDPISSNSKRNAELWQNRLAAEVSVIPGSYHFMRASEPVILQALLDNFLQNQPDNG